MTLKEKIKLVLQGRPVIQNYYIPISEEAFKKKMKSIINNGDDLTPFTKSQVRFNGYFYGHLGYSLCLKSKSSFQNKATLNDYVWLEGTIQPKSKEELNFKATYYRTDFLKKWHLILRIVLSAILVLLAIKFLSQFAFIEFGIALGFVSFFFTIMTAMSINQTSRQIAYFKKNITQL